MKRVLIIGTDTEKNNNNSFGEILEQGKLELKEMCEAYVKGDKEQKEKHLANLLTTIRGITGIIGAVAYAKDTRTSKAMAIILTIIGAMILEQ